MKQSLGKGKKKTEKDDFAREAADTWDTAKTFVDPSMFKSRGYRAYLSEEELAERGLDIWGGDGPPLYWCRGQQFAIESKTLATAHQNNEKLNMADWVFKAVRLVFQYWRDTERIPLVDSQITVLAQDFKDSFCYHEKREAAIALEAGRDPPPIPKWIPGGDLATRAVQKVKDSTALDTLSQQEKERMHKLLEFLHQNFEDAFFNGLDDDGRMDGGTQRYYPLPICDTVYSNCSPYLKWGGAIAYCQRAMEMILEWNKARNANNPEPPAASPATKKPRQYSDAQRKKRNAKR
ncbi:hypothetical protein HDV05_002417, partial [Chytridiales sp. JEL 0842]